MKLSRSQRELLFSIIVVILFVFAVILFSAT